MAFDFSTLITDRSQGDLDALRDLLNTPISDWTAEQLAEFNQAVSKGAYNYTDLNRVTACMDYLNERLTALGYVTGYQRVEVPHQSGSRLPEGYTEVEYIQSSGTQWINTDFRPSAGMRIVMDVSAFSWAAWKSFFGSRNANSSTASQQFCLGATRTQNQLRIDYFGSNQTVSVLDLSVRTTIDQNQNVFSGFGVSAQASPSVGDSSQYPLYLFAVNSVGGSINQGIFQMYSCQIYNDGEMVRDFVPCIDPSGAVGLYDLVGEEFYGNAGTGDFTTGPDVPALEPGPDPLDPYTWYEADVPTVSTMEAYLGNVSALRSVLTLPEDTAQVPGNMVRLTTTEANQIEEILSVISAYLEAMITVFRRCGAAICGGPGFYFLN